MRGILADVNAGGALTRHRFVWLSATWRDLWFDLGLAIEDFTTLGLPFEAPDPTVW